MIISFFEEFPTEENLDKVKLVDFKTKLYIAAKSLNEFLEIKKKIKNKNIIEIIYWPILEMNEGYWFSPFSKRNAILRIFNGLQGKSIPVMIDLELPFTRNKLLFITQAFNFFRNKKLIRKFIENYKNVYTCEYFPNGSIKDKVMKFLGLHFDKRVIKMFYSSMHHVSNLEEELKGEKEKYGNNFIASFGTIAKGILGYEPILSFKDLKNDLEEAKKAKINEVIIFRLGGLNKGYVKVIKSVTTTKKLKNKVL